MSVKFNGHDLGDIFICGKPQVAWINPQPSTTTIPSRDGAVLRDQVLGTLQITFKVTAHDGTQETRRQQFSTLAGWLDVEEPCPLYLPDMVDPEGEPVYYLAIPSGTTALARFIDGDQSDLTFIALSPASYGQTKTETLPSGGSVSIEYQGTYPADFTALGKVTPDVTTGRWGMRNPKDYLHAKTTGENIPIHWIEVDGDKWGDLKLGTWGDLKEGGTWREATHAILVADSECDLEIDTARRAIRINDAYTTPTLDSNFFQLTHGTNTITNDLGTGDVVITYTERWL